MRQILNKLIRGLKSEAITDKDINQGLKTIEWQRKNWEKEKKSITSYQQRTVKTFAKSSIKTSQIPISSASPSDVLFPFQHFKDDESRNFPFTNIFEVGFSVYGEWSWGKTESRLWSTQIIKLEKNIGWNGNNGKNISRPNKDQSSFGVAAMMAEFRRSHLRRESDAWSDIQISHLKY